MTKGLTAKQRRVLEVIVAFIRERGYPPTLAQLAAEIGVSSPTARQHVEALERKGFLEREPRRTRTMRVVEVAAGSA